MERNVEWHGDVPSLQPIWSYTLSNPGKIRYSPLYYDGATYRLVASTMGGICGFTIPTTKEHAPSTLRLSTFSDGRSACVPGLYKAFALYHDDILNGGRIGYDWEVGVDEGATPYSKNGSIPLQPAFDEESGRFVYDRYTQVIILDFLST